MAGRLTDKLAKTLTPPSRGNQIHYDDEISGFGFRVTTAGARSFILNYRISGRERRMTIGSYPTWSVAAARDQARDLRRQIDCGDDPLAVRIEAREAPTIRQLWEEYEATHLPTKRPRSAAEDRAMWQNDILPRFRNDKVQDISHSDIDRLHSEVSKRAPIRANRVVATLRKALNLAVRWGWRADNPCVGVRRNQEQTRERFLSNDEVRRLTKAMDEHPQKSSCDAIRLLLLTGARRGEVLGATWSMFDLEAGVWEKPSSHTKQNKSHRVPLSEQALILLREIREQKRDDVYVFPGKARPAVEGQPKPEIRPLTAIKKTWASICKAAGVSPVRIHDLRHTFASVTISQQHSLPVVGALLGHTQSQTTQRYAHLYDEPLRRAVNDAGRWIIESE